MTLYTFRHFFTNTFILQGQPSPSGLSGGKKTWTSILAARRVSAGDRSSSETRVGSSDTERVGSGSARDLSTYYDTQGSSSKNSPVRLSAAYFLSHFVSRLQAMLLV